MTRRTWLLACLLLPFAATASGSVLPTAERPNGRILVVRESHMGTRGGAWIVALDSTVSTLAIEHDRRWVDWSTRLAATGRTVAYDCYRPQPYGLCIQSLTSTRVVRVKVSGAWTWSPRGGTLAFQSGRTIRFVRADGSASGKSIRVPTNKVQDLAWSRTGELAFVARGGNSTRIWTVHLDGSQLRAVTPPKTLTQPTSPGIDHLTWSADGAKLAYDVQDQTAAHTWILDLRRGRRVRLDGAVGATFSPASDALMLQRWHGDRLELFVRAGGRERRLASNAWSPVWSPDGRWVAYNGGSSIEGVRTDGSASTTLIGARRLPGGGQPASPVDWVTLH